MRLNDIKTKEPVAFYDGLHHPESFKDAFLAGISSASRRISPKFLYDSYGSNLFEAACNEPEYYLPSAEQEALKRCLVDLPRRLPPWLVIIEPGSGSCRKVRSLLEALPVTQYVAIDISGEHMKQGAAKLAREYPHMTIICICADFTLLDTLPPQCYRADASFLCFFPGSTIGNFTPSGAELVLGKIRRIVGGSGYLLIGVDSTTDPVLLHQAYDGPSRLGERFHMNLLLRANRELDATFDLAAFRYETSFDEAESCVVMHLVANRQMVVRVAGRDFMFAVGERIETQRCYKYSPATFSRIANAAGFQLCGLWTDYQCRMTVQFYQSKP